MSSVVELERESDSGRRPLARCTGDAGAFLATSWGRRPTFHERDDPAGFDDLLTLDEVDRILSTTSLRTPSFRLVKAGEQIPSLFPEDSKAGEETAAAPKIWQDMAGFKERAAQLAGDAGQASRSVQDLETFKAALQGVTKNCDACHQVYRIKKS